MWVNPDLGVEKEQDAGKIRDFDRFLPLEMPLSASDIAYRNGGWLLYLLITGRGRWLVSRI